MKCTIRSCTSSAVLQTRSKNISRLNETSTRTTNTFDVAREATTLLVKRRDLLSVAQDFATRFSTMRKTLAACGFLACATRAHASATTVADLARECAKRRQSPLASAKNRHAKFFSTASWNRCLRERFAIGIERITLERFAHQPPRVIVTASVTRRKGDAECPHDETKTSIPVVHATFEGASRLTRDGMRGATADQRDGRRVSASGTRAAAVAMIQGLLPDVPLSRCRACA